jgi:hypothetical protein
MVKRTNLRDTNPDLVVGATSFGFRSIAPSSLALAAWTSPTISRT